MLWNLVCIVLIWVVISGGAVQIPFSAHRTGLDNPEGLRWDLDVAPNPNTTGHLVFETVGSFLQHWPNTRYRNGHNIVPGVIPTGTLLYHGRGDSNVPAVPEWIATDPEHSFLFCRDRSGAGCWQLTLVASRPLQVLYFDGSSAAKMQTGPMDSQDVVTWRETGVPRAPRADWERITTLCDWGKPFGLDGFVRMEMDFEIMYCDFTAGVEIVSFSNLASSRVGNRPGPGPPPGPPPKDPLSYPFTPEVGILAADISFEVIHSGSWHNRYPGDTRIKLDLTRLVSFYDTDLVPSLVAFRQGQERWDHRLFGIDSHDINAVMKRLTAVVQPGKQQSGSGIDWQTLLRVVVDRYADRLDLVQYLLNPTVDVSDDLAQAKKAQTQFRVMLTPYILYSVVPPDLTAKLNNSWASPVFKLCATTHTSYITSNTALHSKLTESEHLLLRAVQETSREICRVIVGLWAEGVVNGLDDFLGMDSESPSASKADLIHKWRSEIKGLMDWLDWSVWIKCRPACGIEEMCYLPTWPFFSRRPGAPGPYRRWPPGEEEPLAMQSMDEDPNDWDRPQPKCIRRFEAYGF